MATRDLTAATNTALQAPAGTQVAHGVEMQFGQVIRQRPATTIPDTEVSWSGRGDLTKLRVYTSIDNGLTWQLVDRSGQNIPGLTTGATTTNRTVLARLLFVDGAPGVVVDSFTLRVILEDGTVVERVETGSELDDGRVINAGVGQPQNGLIALPDISLRFLGNRGGAVNNNDTPHDADGNASGLHLSHGQRNVIPTVLAELQIDNATRLEDAAMAIEGWFNPAKTTGVICGWLRGGLLPGYDQRATLLFDLVETTENTAACLRMQLPGLNAYTMQTPADSVPLNRWSHMAWSYDGFWATLMLNGAVVLRRSLAQALGGVYRGDVFVPFGIVIPTEGTFVFGRHPQVDQNIGATPTNSFDGRLSEWRLYRRRLTIGHVQQRMRRRLVPAEIATMVSEDGLAAYYPMNLGSTTSVLDYSGNNNHLLWDQQQIQGQPQLPKQLAWAPDATQVWNGYPYGPREIAPGIIEEELRVPGRETSALALDVPGEVVRFTDHVRDVTVPGGDVFRGVAGWGGIQTTQESGDLVPTGIELTLSGIQAQQVSLALNARYLDRPCLIYQFVWNAVGELVEGFLLAKARMDTMNVALGQSATVRVSAESQLRNWRRPKLRRWNDEGQRGIWSDDYGFQFLAEMVDRDQWWPEKLARETTPS